MPVAALMTMQIELLNRMMVNINQVIAAATQAGKNKPVVKRMLVLKLPKEERERNKKTRSVPLVQWRKEVNKWQNLM